MNWNWFGWGSCRQAQDPIGRPMKSRMSCLQTPQQLINQILHRNIIKEINQREEVCVCVFNCDELDRTWLTFLYDDDDDDEGWRQLGS